MNIIPMIIWFAIVGGYLLNVVVELLNRRHLSPQLPAEFQGYYDQDKYARSQQYLLDNTDFALIKTSVFTTLLLVFVILGGFNLLDLWAREFRQHYIWTALAFMGALVFLSQLIEIPFAYYHTFVLEEKYGFNKTTLKTFVLDLLKGWVLVVLLGGGVFALVVWFFTAFGSWAPLWCWCAVFVIQIFVLFIAPIVIMPLFNKFVPLADGELKTAVENYAAKEGFKMQGLFTMDGSKRSSKANAFFTGFGALRRIVLFDTLIAQHTVDELVSVLAHEMGHYKKRHIHKFIAISAASMALMFWVLGLVINNKGLFDAFGVQNMSAYAGLVFFGFLYAPLQVVLSTVTNYLSRRYEYDADRYAVITYQKPRAMMDALKKLSVNNLANLTPHPLKVFLEYSHPPVLERIHAIKAISSGIKE
jgi:STE24 endopeptidase